MTLRLFGKTQVILNREKVAFTFGNFDGVHLGHVNLIRQLCSFGLPSVVLTFDPHPSQILSPQEAKPQLEDLTIRIQRLLDAGVSAVAVQSFDSDFSQLTPDEFCSSYLEGHFKLGHVLFGYNSRYGKGGRGNYTHFKSWADEKQISCSRVLPFCIGTTIVSSSQIRQSLESGDLGFANVMLGRPYFLSGEVVAGDKLARQLGFPTANLELEGKDFLPANGVYACEVELTKGKVRMPAVVNIGVRPTVSQQSRRRAEVHIFDLDENLYGQNLGLWLLKYLRKEQKFSGVEELKIQIAEDVANAKSFFKVT